MIRPASGGNLQLGSNVVELLLPQKRPFLMVDFVAALHPGTLPSLEAGRQVSANEQFFAGHFPGMHVWPGTLTIEGLGQTAALLIAILSMRRAAEAAGADPETVVEGLRNLDRGYRLHAGYRAREGEELMARLRAIPPWLAIGASVNVKFLRPVFAGQRLDYRATLSGEVGDMMRFDVEASVDGAPVVSGTMTGARIARPAALP